MATISRLKPNQVVWEVKGSAFFPVKIISIDTEKNTVVASWNGNPPTVFYRNSISLWRVKSPRLNKNFD